MFFFLFLFWVGSRINGCILLCVPLRTWHGVCIAAQTIQNSNRKLLKANIYIAWYGKLEKIIYRKAYICEIHSHMRPNQNYTLCSGTAIRCQIELTAIHPIRQNKWQFSLIRGPAHSLAIWTIYGASRESVQINGNKREWSEQLNALCARKQTRVRKKKKMWKKNIRKRKINMHLLVNGKQNR